MFVDNIKHAFVSTVGSIKDFTLPVQDEFLKIQRHRFGNTEILGILRNADLHFIAGTKEMIYCISAGKNYPGVVLNLYLLLAKILGRNSLQSNKRMEVKFHTVLSRKLKVR